MRMHGAALILVIFIALFPSAHSDLPFTHQFYQNRHNQHQFHQNHLQQCHRNLHYHQNQLPLGAVFAWWILHHAIARITIATTVVQSLLPYLANLL